MRQYEFAVGIRVSSASNGAPVRRPLATAGIGRDRSAQSACRHTPHKLHKARKPSTHGRFRQSRVSTNFGTPENVVREDLTPIEEARTMTVVLDCVVSDYADDVLFITPDGVKHGQDGVREGFVKLLSDFRRPTGRSGGANPDLCGRRFVHRVEGASAKAKVEDGIDTFVFRDGMIACKPSATRRSPSRASLLCGRGRRLAPRLGSHLPGAGGRPSSWLSARTPASAARVMLPFEIAQTKDRVARQAFARGLQGPHDRQVAIAVARGRCRECWKRSCGLPVRIIEIARSCRGNPLINVRSFWVRRIVLRGRHGIQWH